jgi:hypothetical protein
MFKYKEEVDIIKNYIIKYSRDIGILKENEIRQ